MTRLFVSYCWKQRRDAVRQMANCLANKFQFNVWIDNNELADSNLDPMAQGIDQADLVLLFFSEDYKATESCKREAEYALLQKKLILPIRLQYGTQITGWLGMVIGQRLWVDYSENTNFDKAANSIAQQIQLILEISNSYGNDNGSEHVVSSRIEDTVDISAPSPSPSPVAMKPLPQFKTVDVPCFGKYFQRKSEEERILTEIKVICEKPKDGMLVVIGGAGAGKTSLIAHLFTEEENHPFLQRECNVHTVVWFNCFQWRGNFDEQVFTDKLLQLVQKAAIGQQQRFVGLDGAVEYFEQISRRIMFVLDDVQNVKFLEVLFRQCPNTPCLAITRGLELASVPLFIRKQYQFQDMTDESIADMLGSFGLKSKFQKPQLRQLASHCCRLPLIANLLAARFVDSFDFEAEFSRIINEKINEVTPHEIVLQLYETSTSKMEPKMKKSYQAFLFFDPGEPVTVEDLAILWGFIGGDSKIKASAVCNMLEKKCLVRRVVKSDDDKVCYLVHQLLHEAAFESARKETKISVEKTDRFASVARVRILTGEAFAVGLNGSAKQPQQIVDPLLAICEAIKQQRRPLLERAIRTIDAEDLAKLFAAKSRSLTGGGTFLRHLYASQWDDNATDVNNGVNHSYRLIAKLVNKLKSNNFDYIRLFREKNPTSGKSLLFEVFEGGEAYCEERKAIKQLVNRWRYEYDEEKWMLESKTPLVTEVVRWNGRNVDFSTPSENNADTALMIASRLGKYDLVKAIVDKEQRGIAKEGLEGRTALMYASRNGHLQIAKFLVDKKPECANLKDLARRTALSYASENGHVEVVKFLMEKTTTPNDIGFQDVDGRSALMYAAINGHLDVLKLLYEATKKSSSSPLQCQDNDGANAIMLATISGHLETVKFLFGERPETAGFTDKNERNCAMHAAANGHLAILTFLTANVADILRAEDKNKATALFLAAENDHLDVVRFICEQGEDFIRMKDSEGQTALMACAKNGHVDTAAFLVDKAPKSVKVADQNGETALMRAIESGILDLVTLLYDRWPEGLNVANKNGYTTLMAAASNPNPEIVRFIAGKMAFEDDFKVRQKTTNWTAFTYACQSGNVDNVKILYEKWEDGAVAKDSRGWTPLMVAAKNNRSETVKFLLEKCPRSIVHQIESSNGMTAFLMAVNDGNLGVARLIYQANNDVVFARADGSTPLALAVKNDCLAMVEFLVGEVGGNLAPTEEIREEMLKNGLELAVEKGHSAIETYLRGVLASTQVVPSIIIADDLFSP